MEARLIFLLYTVLACTPLAVCGRKTSASPGLSQVVVSVDGKNVPIDVYRDYDARYTVWPDSEMAAACMLSVNNSVYDFRSFGGSYEGEATLPTGKSMFRYR